MPANPNTPNNNYNNNQNNLKIEELLTNINDTLIKIANRVNEGFLQTEKTIEQNKEQNKAQQKELEATIKRAQQIYKDQLDKFSKELRNNIEKHTKLNNKTVEDLSKKFMNIASELSNKQDKFIVNVLDRGIKKLEKIETESKNTLKQFFTRIGRDLISEVHNFFWKAQTINISINKQLKDLLKAQTEYGKQLEIQIKLAKIKDKQLTIENISQALSKSLTPQEKALIEEFDRLAKPTDKSYYKGKDWYSSVFEILLTISQHTLKIIELMHENIHGSTLTKTIFSDFKKVYDLITSSKKSKLVSTPFGNEESVYLTKPFMLKMHMLFSHIFGKGKFNEELNEFYSRMFEKTGVFYNAPTLENLSERTNAEIMTRHLVKNRHKLLKEINEVTSAGAIVLQATGILGMGNLIDNIMATYGFSKDQANEFTEKFKNELAPKIRDNKIITTEDITSALNSAMNSMNLTPEQRKAFENNSKKQIIYKNGKEEIVPSNIEKIIQYNLAEGLVRMGFFKNLMYSGRILQMMPKEQLSAFNEQYQLALINQYKGFFQKVNISGGALRNAMYYAATYGLLGIGPAAILVGTDLALKRLFGKSLISYTTGALTKSIEYLIYRNLTTKEKLGLIGGLPIAAAFGPFGLLTYTVLGAVYLAAGEQIKTKTKEIFNKIKTSDTLKALTKYFRTKTEEIISGMKEFFKTTFYGIMQRFNDMTNNIKNAFEKTKIGSIIINKITPQIRKLTNRIFDDVKDFVLKLTGGIGRRLEAIKNSKLGKKVDEYLITPIKNIAKGIGNIIKSVGMKLGFVNSALLNRTGNFASAIGRTFVRGFINQKPESATKTELEAGINLGTKEEVEKATIGDVIKAVNKGFYALLESINKLNTSILTGFTDILQQLKILTEYSIKLFVNSNTLNTGISLIMNTLIDTIKQKLDTLIKYVNDIFLNSVSFKTNVGLIINTLIDTIKQNLTNIITQNLQTLNQHVENIVTSIKDIKFDSIINAIKNLGNDLIKALDELKKDTVTELKNINNKCIECSTSNIANITQDIADMAKEYKNTAKDINISLSKIFNNKLVNDFKEGANALKLFSEGFVSAFNKKAELNKEIKFIFSNLATFAHKVATITDFDTVEVLKEINENIKQLVNCNCNNKETNTKKFNINTLLDCCNNVGEKIDLLKECCHNINEHFKESNSLFKRNNELLEKILKKLKGIEAFGMVRTMFSAMTGIASGFGDLGGLGVIKWLGLGALIAWLSKELKNMLGAILKLSRLKMPGIPPGGSNNKENNPNENGDEDENLPNKEQIPQEEKPPEPKPPEPETPDILPEGIGLGGLFAYNLKSFLAKKWMATKTLGSRALNFVKSKLSRFGLFDSAGEGAAEGLVGDLAEGAGAAGAAGLAGLSLPEIALLGLTSLLAYGGYKGYNYIKQNYAKSLPNLSPKNYANLLNIIGGFPGSLSTLYLKYAFGRNKKPSNFKGQKPPKLDMDKALTLEQLQKQNTNQIIKPPVPQQKSPKPTVKPNMRTSTSPANANIYITYYNAFLNLLNNMNTTLLQVNSILQQILGTETQIFSLLANNTNNTSAYVPGPKNTGIWT